MAEVTPEAYQSLREFAVSGIAMPNEWDYIALYDDEKNEVLRTSVTGDLRCQWYDLDGDSPVTAEIVVDGGDSDVPTPTTFEYVALWDASGGGRRVTPHESLPTATVTDSADQVTFSHTVEFPEQ